MTKFKNYEEVITDDGSTTLFSKLYNETCHSTSGAVNETITHYIKGCEIERLSDLQSCTNILEVGFGAGIGFLQTMNAFKSSQKQFNFLSLEIDLELIEIFSEKEKIIFEVSENIYKFKKDNFTLYILLGDARKTISKIPNILTDKINAIYQDAFSPKRNAVLWTTEWFNDLKKLSAKNCIMSTYSSSSSIRKSMISAGWILYEGVKFGPKRSSTRARLFGDTSLEISEKLSRSPAIEITDNNYQDYTLGK